MKNKQIEINISEFIDASIKCLDTFEKEQHTVLLNFAEKLCNELFNGKEN